MIYHDPMAKHPRRRAKRSITKQFTAVAILILHERGLVDLDAPVKVWVPDAPASWDQVTVRRLLAHSGRLLTPASLELLTTPVRDQYALGVFAAQAEGNTTIAHSGGLDGFNTYMAYDPLRRTTVIVLGNLNGSAPDALGAALLMMAREGAASQDRGAVPTAETLQAYVGVYGLSPTSSITISIVHGRLLSQITGEEAVGLDPRSGDVFSLGAGDIRLTFTRDASGAVAGMVLYRDGQDFLAIKA